MKVPDRGDVLLLNLDPTKGHEQGGYRPCVVMTKKYYNQKTKMCIVLPMTRQKKNYPFEVKIPEEEKSEGAILTDNITTIDLNARKYKIVGSLSKDIIETCKEYVTKLIS